MLEMTLIYEERTYSREATKTEKVSWKKIIWKYKGFWYDDSFDMMILIWWFLNLTVTITSLFALLSPAPSIFKDKLYSLPYPNTFLNTLFLMILSSKFTKHQIANAYKLNVKTQQLLLKIINSFSNL